MHRLIPLLLVTAVLSAQAWAAVIITSGSVTDHNFGASLGGISNVSFSGTNFSVSGGTGNNGNLLPNTNNCVFATATCSYDFTQSSTGALEGPAQDGSHFTYNGIDYSFGPAGQTSPNYIRFMLNFAGPLVNGPAVECFTTPADGNFCTAPPFGPVPFTMTGSFTILASDHVTVLASDTLSGAGLASTNGAPGSREGTVFYNFTSVPEPTSIGLIATGLVLTRWLAWRRRAA